MSLLEQAKLEYERLGKVIAMLEGTTPTSTKSTATKQHGRTWTAAEKKAMSLKQKAMWAKKKSAARKA